MARPKRPHIPIAVKLEVAKRHLNERGIPYRIIGMSATRALATYLSVLGLKKPELHHNPALGRRHYNKRTGRWTPDANDPEYLEWLDADDHLDRTAGRGGEKMRIGGDTREIAKTRRLEDRRNGVARKKRKTKWPKGRKIESRGFSRRV